MNKAKETLLDAIMSVNSKAIVPGSIGPMVYDLGDAWDIGYLLQQLTNPHVGHQAIYFVVDGLESEAFQINDFGLNKDD